MDISNLKLGDTLSLPSKSGTFHPDVVYAFGHNDASAISKFTRLRTNTTTIRMTGDHFIPTGPDGSYKRAREVVPGEFIRTVHGLEVLIDTADIYDSGLYNPLTFSGRITVDGVAASVHSEWFLDPFFDAIGISQYVPFAYQAILSPIRLMYSVMGTDLYKKIYHTMDLRLGGVADVATEHGGTIFASALAVTLISSAFVGSKLILGRYK